MEELLDAARAYIARGWSVVPIPPRSKGPTLHDWPSLRITDPTSYFSQAGNIGLILGPASGLICVDLDHPLAIELGAHFLPPTGLVAGRGASPGTHWFYRVEGEIENKKHKLPTKDEKGVKRTVVEILGTGNQVVVGPSVHPSGDSYEILAGDPATVEACELAEAVEALYLAVLDRLGLSDEQPAPKPARRKKADYGLAGASPAEDYDARGDVRELLQKHGWKYVLTSGVNEHWRRPGKPYGTSATLKDGKVFYCFTSSTALESGQAYGPFGLYAALEHDGDLSRAASELRQAGFGGDQQLETGVDLSAITQTRANSPGDDTEDNTEDDPECDDECCAPFPDECLQPSGLLGEIVDYCLSTSMYRQPELALAAALALVATITGRKVTDEFGTRTNLYVLGLDESGTGKEQARQINKQLLLLSGGEKIHGSERVGSHAGIVNAVHESPVLLMQLDEIGRLLATMKDPRKAPHLYNCVTVLMQLYSSSGTIWKADAYADSKKVKTIDQPHLVVYGTATPDSFWHNLSTENIGEGLVGRLMVFEGRGYSIGMQKPVASNPPPELLLAVRWWLGFQPGGNLSSEHPVPQVVPHSAEAETRYMQHVAGINQRRKTEDKLRAALWSRCGEKTSKLALLHACSRARGVPDRIEFQDVEFAVRMANWLTRRILFGCRDHVSENEHEGRVKRLLAIIGRDRVTLNQLTRKTQWLKGRERADIIRDLVGCGLLEIETESTGKRPRTVLYRPRKSP